MKRVLSVVLIGIGLAVTVVIAPTYAAPHQTINVTTTDDELNTDSDCSLREAVRSANLDQAISGCKAGSGADEIVLGTTALYTLTIAGQSEDVAAQGDLDVLGTLLITWKGSRIEAGTNS